MKRSLVSILLCAVGAFAQSYPGSIYVPPVAADNVATTLSSAMAAIDTAAVVTSGTGWAANMLAYICDGTQTGTAGKCTSTFEIMKVTGVSGNVLTVTRAQGGTSAIAHAKGKAIYNAVTSPYVNLPSTEITAIETALGTNLVNVLNAGPTVNSASYNFTPQTPGGSLIVGNTSITMTPVPGGVNGSDSRHYLYVSAGTGTAEACLITGGAGTAGQTSGAIIINCAHTHSGAWTIQSASAGIEEAATAIANAGTVTLPRGTLNLYGTMVLPTTLTLIGQGQGTAGSNLVCASAVSPCVVLADANIAVAVGMGGLRDLRLTGSSSTYGLWIGGDPSNGFAPSTWQGNYLRFNNILVSGFTTALTLYQGNFVNFYNSVFSTTTPGPTFYVHPLSGGEIQPVDFYGCVITSDSGTAVQMDFSGFHATPIRYFGGQVSGPLTGLHLDWDSTGTHYEPNSGSSQIVNVTGAGSSARISIAGGQIVGLHGAPLASAIGVGSSGGEYFVTVRNVWVTLSSGTLTTFVAYGASANGSLTLTNNDFGSGSAPTNLYTIAAGAYPVLSINQPLGIFAASATGLAAAATLTFPQANYPIAQPIVITGGTVGGSGVTAVAGLTQGQLGTISTLAAQTFTAGSTIGNTITTTASAPYTYYYDGAKLWIH